MDVAQTNDGGFIVAGSTMSFCAGAVDVYLVKVKPETSPVKVKSNSRHNPNPGVIFIDR